MLFQLFSYITGGDKRKKARALSTGDDPDGDAATLDVLAAIEKFPGIRPDPEALVEALDPLQPRLYSISSSIKANPGRIALTVDTVRYDIARRRRLGVCSTFLADRPYFFGNDPVGFDACAFGFLGVTVYVKGDNPLYRHAASLPNLMAYTERMRARYFPETLK